MTNMIKGLLIIGFIGLSVYIGFQFGNPKYKFYSFRSDAKDITKYDLYREEDVKKRILQRAKELDIPLQESDVFVEKTDTGYKVKASWSETVNIFDQYKKKYDFSFEVGS